MATSLPGSSETVEPPFEHGVPEAIFSRGFYDTIPVGDGREVVCLATSNSVEIYDPSENVDGWGSMPVYHYFAALKRAGYDVNTGYDFKLRLTVRNRNPLSDQPQEKHPGIHPAWLIGRTKRYFEEDVLHGRPVRFLEGNWLQLENGLPWADDNWQQYQAQKQAIQSETDSPLEEHHLAKAAFATWTGNQALRHGFTKVFSVEELDGGAHVIVLFERER